MLPKKNRLTALELKKLKNRKAVFLSNNFLSAKIYPGFVSEEKKIAIVVGKKAINSVQRNKIRRACFNVLKNILVEVQPGFSAIFYIQDFLLIKSAEKHFQDIFSRYKR